MKYVIARNSSNRPTLQHAVTNYSAHTTLCGYFIGNWTRFWSDDALEGMLCKRCKEAAKVPVSRATIIHLRARRRA